MHTISEWMIRFMNRDLSKEESKRFLGRMKLSGLKGPDKSGYLPDHERLQLFEALKRMSHEKR